MRKTLLALVLLAVVWTAAWFVLAIVAGRQVDGFIATEAAAGRRWTCPDRHVGGTPLSLVVTCRDPTFAGEAMGQGVEAQVGGLAATLAAWHPLRVAIAVQPPFSYRSSDGRTAVDATWRTLAFEIGSLPEPRTLSLRGVDLTVHGRVPGADATDWRAAALDARATASPPQVPPVLDLSVAINGMPLPALDDMLGGSDPVDATMTGTVTQASVGEARTPEEALERWRRNGGGLALSTLVLTRGTAVVHVDGRLALDDLHRPAGKLDATFQGLQPILARYGISGDVAALGSLIGTFFGGGRPARATPPGSLALPIALAGGRVAVGPITTPVKLAPLY